MALHQTLRTPLPRDLSHLPDRLPRKKSTSILNPVARRAVRILSATKATLSAQNVRVQRSKQIETRRIHRRRDDKNK
jgi:hypothetical protein